MPTDPVQNEFNFDPQPTGLRIQWAGSETTLEMDGSELIHLNALWKFFGSPQNKDPRRWFDTDEGHGDVVAVAQNLNVVLNDIWKSRRGKHLGGTWSHWQVAVAYVMYLSPDAKVAVIKGWAEHVKEERNPDLKARRAIEGYKRRGYDENWIEGRILQIVSTKASTSDLKEHGVTKDREGNGYAMAHDAINKMILGGKSKECKTVLGIKESEPLRDHLPAYKNAALRFAQEMARETFKEENSQGNKQCQRVCAKSGLSVKRAMTEMGLE